MSISKRTVGGAAAVMTAFMLAMAVLPASAASPPSCLKVSVDDNRRSDTVTVRNTCSTPYAVKVIWAHETDSQCEYLAASIDSFSSTRNWPARYDGLKLC
jgi:P pilus assembly chaperone PapD